MKSYRIYVIGRNGRVNSGEAFEARNDGEAQARMRALAPSAQAAELWEGGRLVGRLSRDGAFSAGP